MIWAAWPDLVGSIAKTTSRFSTSRGTRPRSRISNFFPAIPGAMRWIVKHHGIFQGYYFFHHLDLDRNMRDRFRDHEYWRDCSEFCEKYDQNSFDPEYDTLPLEAFESAVDKVFAAPRKSIYVPTTS
jgi:hypothetical protein